VVEASPGKLVGVEIRPAATRSQGAQCSLTNGCGITAAERHEQQRCSRKTAKSLAATLHGLGADQTAAPTAAQVGAVNTRSRQHP
jgi:hypothetical protein